jgi:hypothetical protein
MFNVAFLLTIITIITDFTVDSPQVQGLRSILAIAHDYDVGTISLPIILKELQSEVESSNRVRARAYRTRLGSHCSLARVARWRIAHEQPRWW